MVEQEVLRRQVERQEEAIDPFTSEYRLVLKKYKEMKTKYGVEDKWSSILDFLQFKDDDDDVPQWIG